jgi:hypothetical protein
MKNITGFALAVFATVVLSLTGCGNGDYSVASVSGRVISNGEPVSGIRLVFAPQISIENGSPGPWSTAVTDAEGAFTLKTRYKKNGAVVGLHHVSFEFDDIDPDAMEDLMEDLEEARGEDGSREEFNAVKKQIADLKRRIDSQTVKVSEEFSIDFDVPKGGTTEANFDLPAK